MLNIPVGEIVARYAEGDTTYALASTYGVSYGTIRNRLRAAGVKLRRRGWRRLGGPLHTCSGYLATICREGVLCYVHRGCYEAHKGCIPSGHHIHHVNGNSHDNRIENLRCVSQADHNRLRKTKGVV